MKETEHQKFKQQKMEIMSASSLHLINDILRNSKSLVSEHITTFVNHSQISNIIIKAKNISQTQCTLSQTPSTWISLLK